MIDGSRLAAFLFQASGLSPQVSSLIPALPSVSPLRGCPPASLSEPSPWLRIQLFLPSSLQPSGFSLQLSGFSLQPSGFSLQLSGFSLQLSGFSLQLSGFSLPAFHIQCSSTLGHFWSFCS